MMMKFLGSFMLMVSLSLAGEVQHQGIILSKMWAKAFTGGPNTAAYVTLKSTSRHDKLVKAECIYATTVELHNHIMENGIAKMRPVEAIDVDDIPVEMKPGGLHIMLMSVKPEFKDQKEITLKLTFEKAGVVNITCPVLKPSEGAKP